MPLWKPAAIADRKRITAYIAQDKPRAATEMGDMLMRKAVQLDQDPTLGRIGRVKGTRELVAHPNYLLIYRIVGKTVEVLRAKHAGQKWP
ncbi:MAG: type II toxin-antitoxin system RelE/ParE family toxin [Nitrosospira sp.]|nr:type II toxin-antitoxin system RelE/ParE family toxin [Nitrosospira sp.]MDN5881059.1 type II toxin-antitoxin system RelE/ParE family toxin [Nitrosospira sp.]MDN5935516.1 type II toxin-antitoxin system RelE/ParE family toxin [Nitrosospira sp.]